jgi:hypothetical protein
VQLAQLVLTVQSQDLLARLDPQDPLDPLVQTETMVELAQQDLLARQDPQDQQAQTARLQDQPDLLARQDPPDPLEPIAQSLVQQDRLDHKDLPDLKDLPETMVAQDRLVLPDHKDLPETMVEQGQPDLPDPQGQPDHRGLQLETLMETSFCTPKAQTTTVWMLGRGLLSSGVRTTPMELFKTATTQAR